MSRRLTTARHASPRSEDLLDFRDEVAAVRDLVVCLCLACSSPILPRDERAALGELATLVRARLEAMADLLDQQITSRSRRA